MTLAELRARLGPDTAAAAKRLADEAPPLTSRQRDTIAALLGPILAERKAS
jgi:hypothetical protein